MSKDKNKSKMTKDMVPDDFTLSLALVDAIPVIFFGLNMLVISLLFSSRLFLLGALLCLIGGAGKVLWKIIVVVKKKNIWPLFIQMRILMPVGFCAIIASLILHADAIHLSVIRDAFLSFPSILFFGVGILGMLLMILFAVKLDNSNFKANWIEQATNGISQAAFFAGLLFLLW